jgi:hypothetical protein
MSDLSQKEIDEGTIDALIERHPEYQELAAQMTSLYEEVIEMAVANEEKGEVKPDIDLSE